MEFRRQKDCLEISELDPFLAELLRQIPESCNVEGVEAAQQRIFSAPAKEAEICSEWKVYVEPELRRLFHSATETVSADLEQLNGCQKPFANYTFTDGELCDHYRSPIGSRRDLGLFQVNFYGFVQEFILQELNA